MTPPHILVADDTPALREALAEMLSLLGYTTTVAADGAAALAQAQMTPPDLIILDHLSPPMDGFAVLDALQADPALQTIPVIFVTATPQAIPRRPGVAAVLGKPFRMEALEKALRSILKSRPAR